MKLSLTYLLLFFCTTISAQPLVTAEYNYRHYGIPDGLPTEIVECVFQDSRGFMWFGTEHGVVCFDGHSFTKYLTDKSLPINKIEETSNGEILIYGYYFVYRLNPVNGKLQLIFKDDNLNFAVFFSAGLPRGYAVYIKRDVRQPALFRFTNDTLMEVFSHPLLEQLYGSLHYDLASQLFYIPASDGKLHVVSAIDGAERNVFNNVHAYRFLTINNELLAIGLEGIWKITPQNATLREKFPKSLEAPVFGNDEDIYVIADADNNLIFHDGKNLFRYRNNTFETIIANITIPRALFFDREGNLWFTSRQGIYNFFSLDCITYSVNAGNGDVTYSVVPVDGEDVYLATSKGKIIFYENNRFREISYPPMPDGTANGTFSYQSIKFGNAVYFLSFDNILQYRNKQFRWLNYPSEMYHVTSCMINQNEFAAGGWGKIMILDNNGKLIREISHRDIGQPTIYTVQADNQNRLWIGGHKGIVRVSDVDTLYFFSDTTMNGEAMSKDPTGRIWIACESRIYYTDNDTIRFFMQIPNTIIGNLCYTRDNLIVISVSTGIKIIDPATRRVVNYDYSNGYSAGEPAWNTMHEDFAGNIWLATLTSNLIKFKPSKFMHNRHIPLLQLTSAQYSDNNIDWQNMNDAAQLPHSKRNFRFSYVGLCFANPQGLSYRYRLLGFQDEWSQLTAEREVSFNNLLPGRYEFQVIADIDSPESRMPVVLHSFTILPAFWQTWWFIAICLVALILITGFFIYIYMDRKNKEKIALLERQKQLNSLQIQSVRLRSIPHFNANVLAGIEYYIMNFSKEEANHYLAMYSAFTNITLSDVDRAARSLEQELQYIELYLNLEKMRFGDSFDFNIVIDPLVDKNILLPNMILHTHCENAIKHGLRAKKDGGKLAIRANSLDAGNKLLVMVEDNGIGRNESARRQTHGNQQGLKILTQQLQLYNQMNTQKIVQHIIDLYDCNNCATGTRIEIEIPKKFDYE